MKPQSGQMPVLQYCIPSQLDVDPEYQRSINNPRSQKLIKAIANDWNWELCQPLVVNRRDDDRLFVIDGQHRLAAANIRGDIGQLPCVITTLVDTKQEAERFVAFNSKRKPLSSQELFRASVACGDETALLVVDLIERNGLKIYSSSNNKNLPADHVNNTGGIVRLVKQYGENVVDAALDAIAQAWKGGVQQYAGTILPGVAATIDKEILYCGQEWQQSANFLLFVDCLRGAAQTEWYAEIMAYCGSEKTTRVLASACVIGLAWLEVKVEAGVQQ